MFSISAFSLSSRSQHFFVCFQFLSTAGLPGTERTENPQYRDCGLLMRTLAPTHGIPGSIPSTNSHPRCVAGRTRVTPISQIGKVRRREVGGLAEAISLLRGGTQVSRLLVKCFSTAEVRRMLAEGPVCGSSRPGCSS